MHKINIVLCSQHVPSEIFHDVVPFVCDRNEFVSPICITMRSMSLIIISRATELLSIESLIGLYSAYHPKTQSIVAVINVCCSVSLCFLLSAHVPTCIFCIQPANIWHAAIQNPKKDEAIWHSAFSALWPTPVDWSGEVTALYLGGAETAALNRWRRNEQATAP